MKTVSIIFAKSPLLCYDFTTPKGSLQAMQQRKKPGKGESNKRQINEWRREKRLTFLSFNFYIVNFGQGASSLTPFS